MSAKSQK